MAKFNAAFDFATEILTDNEDASDITPAMLIAAFRKRLDIIEAEDGGKGIMGACNMFDCHDAEGDDINAPVGSVPSHYPT